MTSNSRNVILPFLTPRCHYQGIGLPHDLPLWALTVEMSYCHSSQLDATTGEVGLPGDVPIWALSLEIWNCHSLPLDGSTRGVDLPVDLPIWALIVETSWSANMSSNSWNLILPFLATRCHYQGGRFASWSVNMSSNSRNVKLLSAWAVRISNWIFQYESHIVISRGCNVKWSAGAAWSASMSSNSEI